MEQVSVKEFCRELIGDCSSKIEKASFSLEERSLWN